MIRAENGLEITSETARCIYAAYVKQILSACCYTFDKRYNVLLFLAALTA